MNFIERVFESMRNKKFDKLQANRGNAPVANKTTISNQNAQSWNTETHPDGRGPSQLVETIDYDSETGNLDVGYRDGFRARYKNIDPDSAKQFNAADSKGRWAQKHLFDKDYEAI